MYRPQTRKTLLQRCTDLRYTNMELHRTIDAQLKQIHKQEVLLHELGEHLGNALYSDEWNTREYGICAFNDYQRTYPMLARDVDEMLDR